MATLLTLLEHFETRCGRSLLDVEVADLPADCWESAAPGLVAIERLNTNGLYPPIFYATMSVFATTDVAASVLSIRLVNSAFAVALITATFWLLPRRLRPALIISVVGTAVPLGLFVLASTNPSSWAFVAAAITWVSLYGATQSAGRRSVALAVMAVFGSVIGAGARADAGAFAVFAVIIVALLASRRRRATLVPAIAAGAIVLIGGLFYLGSTQGLAVSSGLDQSRAALTPGQHLSNLLGVPQLWTGALGGGRGLGWLDTPMPAVVWVLTCSSRFSSRLSGSRSG
ncbi:DUF2142 domain-containing protein [Microbacterium lacus]|uniref:DUF2142 domain-containing protein n=1 Tax=Microbacterium lacus TaxID=415217 RepID=UPI00384B7490